MAGTFRPKFQCKCPKCGWTGDRAREARACPKCGHWHPRRVVREQPERAAQPRIWNCWTRNYSRRDDGYITHAFDELSEQYQKHNRTLCGAQIADSGLVSLGEDGWKPGCFRCCRILTGLRMLTPD